MIERRHFVRWQINQRTKIKIEGAETFMNCAIRDISFKGLRIHLAQKLPTDTFLKLNIVLSEDYNLGIIEVWVVWHKSIDGVNVYGFYFNKIKDSDKEKIYKFVRNYFPQELNKRWWEGLAKEKEGGEVMQKEQKEKLEDRRIFARFSAKLPLRFLDLRGNREGEAQTQDISAKGIGLLSKEELSPQTPLEMWLEMPDKGQPLYTRGEVIWSKQIEPGQWRTGIDLEKADLMGMSRLLRKTA